MKTMLLLTAVCLLTSSCGLLPTVANTETTDRILVPVEATSFSSAGVQVVSIVIVPPACSESEFVAIGRDQANGALTLQVFSRVNPDDCDDLARLGKKKLIAVDLPSTDKRYDGYCLSVGRKCETPWGDE